MLWHTCGGQRIIYKSQFSPSTMWAPGIKLRFLGLMASISTSWTISLARISHFNKLNKGK